jgi:hypothetical protein
MRFTDFGSITNRYCERKLLRRRSIRATPSLAN